MSCIISITIIGFSHMLYAIENLQLGLALIYCYLTYPYLQLALILAVLCCFYFSGCFSFLFYFYIVQKIKIPVPYLALLSLKFSFSVSVSLTGVFQIILLTVLITLLPCNTEEPVIFFFLWLVCGGSVDNRGNYAGSLIQTHQ